MERAGAFAGCGGGVDRLSGGAGDDTLNTVDGSTDDSVVGGGHVVGDTCVVDAGDFIVPAATPREGATVLSRGGLLQ